MGGEDDRRDSVHTSGDQFHVLQPSPWKDDVTWLWTSQSTTVTDTAEHVAKAKWPSAGHITPKNDNRPTTAKKQRQIPKGARWAGRPER